MKKALYRVLVVGNDGRAHAIYRACQHSPYAEVTLGAPGNGGMHRQNRRAVNVMEFDKLVALCKSELIDLVIVSPEGPLCAGIVDYFKEHAPDVMVFGPSLGAARLEASKSYGNHICREANIRKGAFEVVRSSEQAMSAIELLDSPVVVKEDGLAAGKGVSITHTREATLTAVKAALLKGPVVLEEFIKGPEVSFICFVSGTTVVPLSMARDFKRASDNDDGPNTGGMGAYTPLPEYPEGGDIYRQLLEMARAAAVATADVGHPFVGLLYVGAKVTNGLAYQIEFNCRGGDPEMEPLLMNLRSDFLTYVIAACEGDLKSLPPLKSREGAAVCVVVASAGYPDNPKPQGTINHEWFIKMDALGVSVHHAGTREDAGVYTPTGGRVFMLCARAATHEEARRIIYSALEKVGPPFPGAWWRTDIATNANNIVAD